MKQTQKDYKAILDNLDSAEGYPDSKAEDIRGLRRKVFVLIENEKNEAKRLRDEAKKQTKIAKAAEDTAKVAKATTDRALHQATIDRQTAITERENAKAAEDTAKVAKATTDRALHQATIDRQTAIAEKKNANSVLDKIYFYDGKFGLAFDSSSQKYGFIDKNLKVKINFKYSEALQFDKLGFSNVKRLDSLFLIDTSGNEFPLKTNLFSIKLTVVGFVRIFFSRKNTTFKALNLSNEGRYYYPIYLEKYLKQKIEILYLDNNKLKKIPDRITKIKNLKHISASNNRITNICSSIISIRGLLRLALNNNNISKIPNDIDRLEKIEFLNLSFNQIEEIPISIGDLKLLRHLDLRHNHVYSMPLEVVKMKSLRHLDLRENPIDKEEQKKIQKLLPYCNIYFN